MNLAASRVADGPHGRLLLADALSVGKKGERTLVLVPSVGAS
jgi:hypothetical protein